jgi:respiratory burst oxidase
MGEGDTHARDPLTEKDLGDAEDIWAQAKVGWKNRRLHIVWIAIYFVTCTSIFVQVHSKWVRNIEATAVFGECIALARASAATLNFNAAIILLPISRHYTTWFRSTRLRFILFPFEAILDFHMLIGCVFAVFSVSHVLAHVCDYTRFANADQEDIAILFGDQLGETVPVSKSGRWGFLMKQRASITGVIMVICMVTAYSVLRSRRKNFNRFWYSHHLLLLMLLMMCVHGTGNFLQHFQTIYWLCIPLGIYFIPRLYREVKCQALKVRRAEIHGNVLDLQLEKPAGWERLQKAGMYAYVNIPEISKTEWHPFSLSSSPDQDHIGFHIKDAGDWTSKAHKLFQFPVDDEEHSVTSKTVSLPTIRVEGPIGASSQGFRDHKIVVLIGAGIGITVSKPSFHSSHVFEH